jgi:hypothetical protein
MPLPSSYLTSTKNLGGILNTIIGAQAPEKFTVRFLESLGYKSSAERLIIGVLKSLNFLEDDGRPTQRYHDYLDQTQSEAIMAEAVKEAYADLFQVNKNAQNMTGTEVFNKLKTLSQGQYSESVLKKMSSTFISLCTQSDFANARNVVAEDDESNETVDESIAGDTKSNNESINISKKGLSIGGLVYNIQLILPESRTRRYMMLYLSH